MLNFIILIYSMVQVITIGFYQMVDIVKITIAQLIAGKFLYKTKCLEILNNNRYQCEYCQNDCIEYCIRLWYVLSTKSNGIEILSRNGRMPHISTAVFVIYHHRPQIIKDSQHINIYLEKYAFPFLSVLSNCHYVNVIYYLKSYCYNLDHPVKYIIYEQSVSQSPLYRGTPVHQSPKIIYIYLISCYMNNFLNYYLLAIEQKTSKI